MMKTLILIAIIVESRPSKYSKGGGVYLYNRDYLSLIERKDFSISQECLMTEISVNNTNSSLHVFIGLQVKVIKD